MDPLSLISTVIAIAKAISKLYEDTKAVPGAVASLHSTVKNAHNAFLIPLEECMRGKPIDHSHPINDCLESLREALTRANDHILVWDKKKTWTKKVSFALHPEKVLDSLKEDQATVFQSTHLLFIAASFSGFMDRSPTPVAKPKKNSSSTEMARFWDKLIGSRVQRIPMAHFCKEVGNWLSLEMTPPIQARVETFFDEYGFGKVDRLNALRVAGSRPLASIAAPVTGDLQQSSSHYSPRSRSILIWVDDNPEEIQESLDAAQGLDIEVLLCESTAVAKALIEQNINDLLSAGACNRLFIISDLLREASNLSSSGNVTEGESLLRYIRGRGFECPFLIHTTRDLLPRTEFVTRYINAGSCSSIPVVSEYLCIMTGDGDDDYSRQWNSYAALSHMERRPVLFTIMDDPEMATKHIEFSKARNVVNITASSPTIAIAWFRKYKAQLQKKVNALPIRIICGTFNVGRHACGPRELGLVPDKPVGAEVLRILHSEGFTIPLLVYGRDISTTQFVNSFEASGSTRSDEVVELYIKLLTRCSSIDESWWRHFSVLPRSSTRRVIVWMGGIFGSQSALSAKLQKSNIDVIRPGDVASAQSWIIENAAMIRSLTCAEMIRFFLDFEQKRMPSIARVVLRTLSDVDCDDSPLCMPAGRIHLMFLNGYDSIYRTFNDLEIEDYILFTTPLQRRYSPVWRPKFDVPGAVHMMSESRNIFGNFNTALNGLDTHQEGAPLDQWSRNRTSDFSRAVHMMSERQNIFGNLKTAPNSDLDIHQEFVPLAPLEKWQNPNVLLSRHCDSRAAAHMMSQVPAESQNIFDKLNTALDDLDIHQERAPLERWHPLLQSRQSDERAVAHMTPPVPSERQHIGRNSVPNYNSEPSFDENKDNDKGKSKDDNSDDNNEDEDEGERDGDGYEDDDEDDGYEDDDEDDDYKDDDEDDDYEGDDDDDDL